MAGGNGGLLGGPFQPDLKAPRVAYSSQLEVACVAGTARITCGVLGVAAVTDVETTNNEHVGSCTFCSIAF